MFNLNELMSFPPLPPAPISQRLCKDENMPTHNAWMPRWGRNFPLIEWQPYCPQLPTTDWLNKATQMMSMFASSLSPFNDTVQTVETPAPILIFGRLLLLLSNVLGNVLASVYTTNIYIYQCFLVLWYRLHKKEKQEGPIPAGGPQEVVHMRHIKHDCKSLPQNSCQMVRQTIVSLITPKSHWYRT